MLAVAAFVSGVSLTVGFTGDDGPEESTKVLSGANDATGGVFSPSWI